MVANSGERNQNKKETTHTLAQAIVINSLCTNAQRQAVNKDVATTQVRLQL